MNGLNADPLVITYWVEGRIIHTGCPPDLLFREHFLNEVGWPLISSQHGKPGHFLDDVSGVLVVSA
jgi:hypothetical protein